VIDIVAKPGERDHRRQRRAPATDQLGGSIVDTARGTRKATNATRRWAPLGGGARPHSARIRPAFAPRSPRARPALAPHSPALGRPRPPSAALSGARRRSAALSDARRRRPTPAAPG